MATRLPPPQNTLLITMDCYLLSPGVASDHSNKALKVITTNWVD